MTTLLKSQLSTLWWHVFILSNRNACLSVLFSLLNLHPAFRSPAAPLSQTQSLPLLMCSLPLTTDIRKLHRAFWSPVLCTTVFCSPVLVTLLAQTLIFSSSNCQHFQFSVRSPFFSRRCFQEGSLGNCETHLICSLFLRDNIHTQISIQLLKTVALHFYWCLQGAS